MAVYHRTQRLQIYGEKPEVTQLFGGRYRMVVRCKAARDTEAWYNANKDQIFASFGTLYSAQMSVDGIDPRSGEAYPDMCLVSNNASYTQTGEYVISFVYETLTDTWTQEQGDQVSSTDNGLRIVERSEVAKITATAPYDEDDVGVSTITNGVKTLYLASFQDQTGAESNAQVGRVVTRWAEAGTLNRSEDKVGSQQAITIQAIGEVPATPAGYSLAKTSVGNYEGFQTNDYTFLEPSILSVSTPKVGGQQRVQVQAFNLGEATVVSEVSEVTASHELVDITTSDVEGIPTRNFTFEVDNFDVRSTTDNGLLTITRTDLGTVAYSDGNVGTDTITEGAITLYLAGDEIDNGNTIKKRVSRWAEAGILSRTEDFVGSQDSLVIEAIGPDPSTPSGFSLASKQESNYEGLQTNRFTFLKDNVVLSVSEDKVGSQKAIVNEVFNPASEAITGIDTSGTALTGYSEANRTESDYEGIKTIRVQFLKPSILSQSEDKVGSQQAIVIEAFGEFPATPAGYSLARTDVSDFEGIKTNRYTFLRPSILSVSQERTGGATTVQVRVFELTEAEVDTLLSEVTSSHILISQSESDYDGIVTSQFTYEIDDFEIKSQSEDGMEIIVRTELRATDFSSGVIGTSTYKTLFLIEENIDNGNAIKKRTSRYSEAGVLSISPLEEDGFSLAPSYVYVTTGAPASSMTGLVTPDGTTLGTSVTWFEPKVQNVKGFPTYTQQVLTVSIIGDAVKIHSVNKFFTITEPGVMSTGGAFNSAQKSGAATRYPKATKQPRTYRKKATVDVYLTTSNLITESEVAFTEEGVDWCSIGFDSFYTNEIDSSASVSSSWRSFPQYLNSSGTTDTANASSTGVYFAEANSYGAGATTYTTTGIYRVELEKYTRAADGTQLYLKTIVTF